MVTAITTIVIITLVITLYFGFFHTKGKANGPVTGKPIAIAEVE